MPRQPDRDQLHEEREILDARLALGQEVALETLEPADGLPGEAANLGEMRATGMTSSRRPCWRAVSSRSGMPASSSAVVPPAPRDRPVHARAALRVRSRRARRHRRRQGGFGLCRWRRDPWPQLSLLSDVGMKASELDYELPPELIAQGPLARRDESRLLVFERAEGAIEHARSRTCLVSSPESLVVVNDTRVLPARLKLSGREAGRRRCFCSSASRVTSGRRSRGRAGG